jgi:hypothetical protein
MGVRLGGPYFGLYGTIPVVFYRSQVQYPRRNRSVPVSPQNNTEISPLFKVNPNMRRLSSP